MSCNDRQIQISLFLRGELSEPEVKPLLDHLEGCEDCRAVEQELRSVDCFLAGSTDPVVPPFLSGRIIARIAERMRTDANAGAVTRFFRQFRVLKPAQAAGVVFVALFLGVVTGASLLSWSISFRQGPQSDVVALAFGPSVEPASFESVCFDYRGNR